MRGGAAALERPVVDYTTGNLAANIWRLAAPMTLEMTIANLFQIAELYFMGFLGSSALAAVSLSGSIRWILTSLAMGLGVGSGAVVARRVGERDLPAASHATTQALLFGAGLGVCLGLIGMVGATPLVTVLGAGEDLLPPAVLYLRLTFVGLPIITVALVLSAVLRGAGNAREALWLAIIGNLANVALLPLLVQGMIGLPPLGVAGAALSTVFAQAIAVTVGTGTLLSGRARVALLWRRVRPDWAVIRTMVTIGIPSAVQAVLRSSSRVAMIAIVAPFGTAAIAGYGVATRLTVMLLTPGFGMGNAAGTLVGQNLGAQKPQRAERSAWAIAWVNLAFMLVAMALMALKAPEVVVWFNCTEDVAEVAVRAIRVVAIAYAFSAVGVVMGRALDGAGNTMPAMMVNLTTLWGVQVPVGLVLSRFTPLALDGVWVGWALASMANAAAMAYWFRRGGWKRKKV